MSESLVEVVHVFWETSHSGLVILSSDWDESDQALPLTFGPDRNVLQSFQSLSLKRPVVIAVISAKRNSGCFESSRSDIRSLFPEM